MPLREREEVQALLRIIGIVAASSKMIILRPLAGEE